MRVSKQWRDALPSWAEAGSVRLYPELQAVLTRAVCGWAGLPLVASEVGRRTGQLSALFDDAGGKGVRHLRARVQRVRADR
jgi:fatty-acid peroxygenase